MNADDDEDVMTIFGKAFQLYTEGDGELKLATTGAALLVAAVTEAARSVLGTLVAFFWACDMVSGVIRSVRLYGLAGFSLAKFAEGFGKMLAGLIGIGIGVGIDLFLADSGATQREPFTATAMGLVAFGFGTSAAKNIAFWWPSLARILIERGLSQGPLGLDERSREKVDP